MDIIAHENLVFNRKSKIRQISFMLENAMRRERGIPHEFEESPPMLGGFRFPALVRLGSDFGLRLQKSPTPPTLEKGRDS